MGVDGNIDVDPQFVNENLASLDLRLQGGSACIDAGNAVYLSTDYNDLNDNGNTSEGLPFDLTGAARIQGGKPDQGAYEQ